MFCYNCGAQIAENGKFCHMCGAPVKVRRNSTAAPFPAVKGSSAAMPSAAAQTHSAAAPSFSWGSTMPAEENQYSYPGPYLEYFKNLFRENFPQYEIDCRQTHSGSKTIFSFRQSVFTRLVVELRSENSRAKKLQQQCENAGIPYLRFYYNHHGWWNTKSYVLGRVRGALGTA